MELYSTTFVFEEKESPECYIWQGKSCIYVQFRPKGNAKFTAPEISFFIQDEQGLVNFKNKVLWAYEEFMREKEAVKC